HFKEQQIALKRQLEWSIEKNLPVVIHSRDSFEEIFDVLDQMNHSKLRGVFHCFGGNAEQAKHILSYKNFKFGIGGVLTFKNSGLAKVVAEIGLENILLETDSPYLTPVPFRGKRNESSYTYHIAEKLADIYNVSIEKVAEITSSNARKLFNF
ncbi:MAG: TatD family hydrolase, partial [Bacteroidales bacterium]|nr:TatD family hydrolase [Bacteroidales bacterium]